MLPLLILIIILLLLIGLKKKELFENKKKKKYFITFSDGNKNFINAGKRIKKQAENTKLFDKYIHYTDDFLKKDKEFWNKHKNFIKTNKKGHGYYIWKPYVIKKTMDILNDGDILLYLDAGCEIDIRKRNKLKYFLEKVKKDLIIGTTTHFLEKCWTKKDLSHKMKATNKDLNSKQRQGGVVLFYICDKTRKLVNEWDEIAQNQDLISSRPSKLKNDSCFKDNRHDQSIFSLLTKKYNIYSKSTLSEAINIIRNKSGNSKLK